MFLAILIAHEELFSRIGDVIEQKSREKDLRHSAYTSRELFASYGSAHSDARELQTRQRAGIEEAHQRLQLSHFFFVELLHCRAGFCISAGLQKLENVSRFIEVCVRKLEPLRMRFLAAKPESQQVCREASQKLVQLTSMII